MANDNVNGPNEEQLESKLTIIKGAESVLETAKADRLRYLDNEYTVEMMREDVATIEEQEAEGEEEEERKHDLEAVQLPQTSDGNKVDEEEEEDDLLPTPPLARGRK